MQYLTAAKIRNRIYALRQEIALVVKKYDQAVKELSTAIKAQQDKCPHPTKTRHMGSPYDSSYSTCDYCDKEC